MGKNLFVIAVFFLVVSIFGCGKTNDSPDCASDDTAIPDPIKATLSEQYLGNPIDWQSLQESDKAFLCALQDRDAAKAREALAAGANADIDCGHGCNALMLAAATGDMELVAAIKKAGVRETPAAKPYLEILNFSKNAERPTYKAALETIEKITGVKPIHAERVGAYKVALKAEAAENFLEKHHEHLLGDGCYVFLYEQNFGIDNQPDILWILPTNDKFAVMAFVGVNGINYGIDNHLVILWMRRLEREHPYRMTGCGQDFLSGRFKSKLTDINALAQRMYAFCPDIVEQGTGSVKALASELRATNQLYFWWD